MFRLKPVALVFGVALLVFIGVGGISYRNTKRLLEAAKWREHTERVIAEIRAVVAKMEDIETGSRGFIITGDVQFLEPYHSAREEFQSRLTTLRSLTADNPLQQRRLDAIEPLTAAKIEWAGETIALRRDKGFEAAATAIRAGRGKTLMDEIRALLADMEAEERGMSARRDVIVKASVTKANVTHVVGTVLSVILLLGVFFALDREIRDRQRAEAERAASEARLQAILDHSPAIISLKDLDGRFLLISRQFEHLFHIGCREAVGKTVHELFPKEIADAYRAADMRALEAGAPLTLEQVARQEDGVHTYLSTKFPLRDPSGAVYALGGISTDITLRKRAEDELRRLQMFLDSVLENIPNMIFVKDARTLSFVRLNRAAEELLGSSRESLIGKNDYDFFPREEADFFTAKDRQVLESSLPLDIPDELIQTKHQGLRSLHTKKVPILDEAGRPQYLLGISEDITERKKAQDEIETLNQTLRLRSAHLEAANKELEAFSYSVSHDLRAPLRSIDGFSQALLEDCAETLDERGKQHVQRVRAATQRMGQLIDDLLSLSRLTRGEMRRGRVDLTDTAKRIAEELRKSQPERRVELKVEEGLVAEGDGRFLSVALENLFRNAWKFTRDRPIAHIEFGAMRQNGQPVFFLRDDGAGFEMAYAGKLFGAFQRLHAAKDFEGTGIGLATVARIVGRHGGRVWAEGVPEKGATFYFTL